MTTPFWFEGTPRSKAAHEGYEKLRGCVDSIVKVPNDKLLEMAGKNTPLMESFKLADDALRQGIQGLTEIIVKPSFMNLDFADVKKVMRNSGSAHMGIGVAKGENRVIDAVEQAILSPLLDTTIQGAKGIILNMIVDPACALPEIEEASRVLKASASPDAEKRWILGVDIDTSLEDEVRVTVIATGFDSAYSAKEPAKEPVGMYLRDKIGQHDAEAGNALPGRPQIEPDTIKPIDYSEGVELEVPRVQVLLFAEAHPDGRLTALGNAEETGSRRLPASLIERKRKIRCQSKNGPCPHPRRTGFAPPDPAWRIGQGGSPPPCRGGT